MKPFNLILVEDSETDKLLICEWLKDIPQCRITSTFSNPKEFLYQYKNGKLKFEILLLDQYLPYMNGLEVIDYIDEKDLVKTLLISNGCPGKLAFIKSKNIAGFVEKNKIKIQSAIELICSGVECFDESFIAKFENLNRNKSMNEQLCTIKVSAIESEIINLMSCGKSYKEIQQEIPRLSERTIETYIRNMRLKLNLVTNSQLIKWAMLNNIIYMFDDLK